MTSNPLSFLVSFPGSPLCPCHTYPAHPLLPIPAWSYPWCHAFIGNCCMEPASSAAAMLIQGCHLSRQLERASCFWNACSGGIMHCQHQADNRPFCMALIQKEQHNHSDVGNQEFNDYNIANPILVCDSSNFQTCPSNIAVLFNSFCSFLLSL